MKYLPREVAFGRPVLEVLAEDEASDLFVDLATNGRRTDSRR
jgi:hypothetical protein